jgi:hypothetical protein
VLSGALAAALLVAGVADAAAQNAPISSTLRYGTGVVDVPDASVLPHLTLIGTYSGFYVNLDQTVITDDQGRAIGFGDGYSDWRQDGSIALGLFDWVELGATFQNFSEAGTGGTLAGAFGKLRLLKPENTGLGLAVGIRYITEPTFDDIDPNRTYKAPRLGFPDQRFYNGEFSEGHPMEDWNDFTPYIVGNFKFQGMRPDWFPEWDMTLTGGWGQGMFYAGHDLDWYANAHSYGFFGGATAHIQAGDNTLVNLKGEWNGFDANLGAELDWKGVQLGAYVLGANYLERITEYKSPKFAMKVTVGLCMGDDVEGIMCRPRISERESADTVQLPAPPADTVIVEREVAPPIPRGTPSTICLATGRSEQIFISASGDTLVGPNRVSIDDLGGVVFEGNYAAGAGWFTNDEELTLDRERFQKSGGEIGLDCADIMIVGEFNGVNVFADRNADQPYDMVYVPVRPGVWQAYENLRRTRG